MIYFSIILSVYIILSAVLHLQCKWWWKAGGAVAVLLAAFKFHILHWLGGGPGFFAPELPGWILVTFAWVYAMFFIFFFMLMAADAVRLTIYLYKKIRHRSYPENYRKLSNRINLILLIFSMITATYGVISGSKLPEVRTQEVEIENLPEEFSGFKIAVLADLHVDSMTRAGRIQKLVDMTNALQPDAVVLVGDFVDGSVNFVGKELLGLKELRAKYGVYGVPGNHEYYSGYQSWMDFLENLGVKMLLNENVCLGKTPFALAGVTDSNAKRFNLEAPDLDKALSGIPADKIRILLAHKPVMAHEADKKTVDLQISGHTHGGMAIGFDLIIAAFNGGYSAGLYQLEDLQLYVNRGSGIWSGFPVRVGIDAEITLLKLEKD